MWIVPPDKLDEVVANIKMLWKPEGKVFVFNKKWEIPPTEFYITWNTTYDFKMPGVIKINRRGTTLFTIDALNQLSIESNGKIDKEWSPDWENYRNHILLMKKDGSGVNQIETVIYEMNGNEK